MKPKIRFARDAKWKFRAFQIDLRALERPEKIAAIIKYGARVGYNVLFLYSEGQLQFESHPECNAASFLTKPEFRELQTLATQHAMQLIPIIPTWGHTHYIWKNDCHADIRELRPGSGRLFGHGNQLCPSQEKTYTVLEEMLGEWAKETQTPYLHIGGDESWNNGVCPDCRKRHGDLGAGNVMVEHYNRLNRIVKGLGKTTMIWADMPFYYPGSIDRLDRDIIMVDWHYDQQMDPYPPMPLASHRKIPSLESYLDKEFNTIFCTATGVHYFPGTENMASFCRYAGDKPVMGLLNTVWELFDTPYDLALPVLAYGAEAAVKGRIPDSYEFLAEWAGDHFRGDARDMAEIVKAVVELKPHARKGTVDQLEYGVSFDLLGKIHQAGEALRAMNRMQHRDPIGRAYKIAAKLVFTRARFALETQKFINLAAAALQKRDYKAMYRQLTLLNVKISEIPRMLTAEKKWWKADRYPDDENVQETYFNQQAKALPEFVAAVKAVALGKKNPADLLPGILQLWMTVDAPMWAETTIEVSPDGKEWTKIYEVPQCEPYMVGPRNTAFRHTGEIRQLRISVTGIGGFVMHYLKLIFHDRILAPTKILSHEGAVTGAENLLVDDRRPTVFGDYEFQPYFRSAQPQPPCVVTMEVGPVKA
jgi:hypothetical protein